MKLDTVNLKRNEWITIIAVTLLFMMKGAGLYDGQKIFACLLIGVFVLLAAKFAGETFGVGEIAVYLVLGGIALYNYYLSRDKGLLLCFCMILLVKNVNIDYLIKSAAVSFGVFGLLRAVVSAIGIAEHKVLLHDKLGGEIIRYSFGQPHPNVMHMTYLVFCCMVLFCLQTDKRRLFFWNVLFVVGNVILFVYTVSFTGALLGVLLFFFVFIFVYFPRVLLWDWIFSFGILLGTVAYSVIFPCIINYDNEITQSLLWSLYNRFRLLNSYFSSYPITMWGQNILDLSKVNYQLDNSWATLLLGSGTVIFGIMLFFYGVGLYYLLKQGRKLEVYIVLLLLIGGLSDPFLFNTSLKNIGLLFLGSAIYSTLCGNEENKIVVFRKWNRFLNQYVKIKMPVWTDSIKLSGRKVVLEGIAALVVSLCIMQLIHMPKMYCVSGVDPMREGVSIEEVYVTQEMLDDSSIRVYSYRDSQTPMWMVDSERVRVIEYGRMLIAICLISLGVICFLESCIRKKGNLLCRSNGEQ